MQEMTRNAIAAILAADSTATEDERTRITDALSGELTPLTVRDAAARLGVSRPTLYRMLRTGVIRRLGDGRVSARSVAEYFNAKEVANA